MAAAQLTVPTQTTDPARGSSVTASARAAQHETRPAAAPLDLRRQGLGRCWGA